MSLSLITSWISGRWSSSRSATDKTDIDAMIDRDLVPHDRLLERFRSAAYGWAHTAHADQLHKYVDYLHELERDMLGVDESEIELPSWV